MMKIRLAILSLLLLLVACSAPAPGPDAGAPPEPRPIGAIPVGAGGDAGSTFYWNGAGKNPGWVFTAGTSAQLDANSLVSSFHYWPETNNQLSPTGANWPGLGCQNFKIDGSTWVNQGANAGSFGISAQEFVNPPGNTSVTMSFQYIQDGVHTPAAFTCGIHDGSTGFVNSLSATPTSTLTTFSVTATGLTPGNRYYALCNANSPSQSSFWMTGLSVTPNNATGLFALSTGFQRQRIDGRDYQRNAHPGTWHASGYVQTASPFSYVEVITNATSLGIEDYADIAQNYISAGLRIDVNGKFNQYVDLFPDTTPAAIHTVTLPEGMKLVRITIGSQAWNAGRTAVIGSWLRALYWPAGALVQIPAKPQISSRHVLFYGDSITVGTTGNFSHGTSIGDRSGPNLATDQLGSGVEAYFDAYGARALTDDVTTQATANALVHKWAEAHPTDIWLAMGANDYIRPTVSSATFQTDYGYLLSAINAILPGVRVWAQSPLPEVTETANSFGSTLPNYRTAISSACSAAQSCQFIDATTFGITAASDTIADGIHPNDNGHAKWAQNIVADIAFPFSTAPSGGSSVTWANDLAGSTNLHQWLAGISGSGGTGGSVPIASNAYLSVTANTCFLKTGTTCLEQTDATPAHYLNGIGSLVFQVGGVTDASLTSTALNLTPAALTWVSTALTPTISQTAQGSDAATSNLVIASQAPFASATTHKTPGNILLNVPAPVGGSTGFGYVGVQYNTTTQAAISIWPTSSTYGAFYLGGAGGLTPGSTNFTILADQASGTWLNGASSVNLRIGGTTDVVGVTTTGVTFAATAEPATDLGASLGTTSLRWAELDVGNQGGNTMLRVTGTNGAEFYLLAQPKADLAADLGAASRRWGNFYTQHIQYPVSTGTPNGSTDLLTEITANGRTTTASAVTVYNVPIPNGDVVTIDAACSAKNTGSIAAGSTWSVRVVGAFWASAGVVTQAGTTTTIYTMGGLTGTGSVNFVTSTGSVAVQVASGNSGFTTEDWQCIIRQSTN